MELEVTVTWLEMTEPGQLRPVTMPQSAPELTEALSKPALSARLYRLVGDRWGWHERRDWTAEQWAEWLGCRRVRTWLASDAGTTVGYFQLAADDDGGIEIAYLGLAAAGLGRGWGGWLLTRAVQEAWAADPERVWLHTCTLDHPAALPNYLARGFRIVESKTEMRAVTPAARGDRGALPGR